MPLPLLGGDSKTLMFVQISPNERDLGETICSLNFASRVRGVELGPAKKQLDAAEYLRSKQLVKMKFYHLYSCHFLIGHRIPSLFLVLKLLRLPLCRLKKQSWT